MSAARVGSTSIETYPSRPPVRSQTGRSTSQAAETSRIASAWKTLVTSPSLLAIWASYAEPRDRALPKMLGFEVTPTTASSAIARARPPDSIKSRDRKSIQTLWPSAESCSRRVIMTSRRRARG